MGRAKAPRSKMGMSEMEYENQERYYIGIISIAGVVAMIEASMVYAECSGLTSGWTVPSDECTVGQGWYIYGVCVGVIPAFFGLLMGAMHLCNPESVTQLMHQVAAFVFWIWCGVGALITTFYAPFTFLANGYFAVWAMAIASTLYLAVTFQEARVDMSLDFEVPDQKLMAMLFNFSASIVVLISVLLYLKTTHWTWNGWTTWALVCSAFGIVFSGIMIPVLRFVEIPDGISQWASLFYFVWWAIGTATMTFQEPFVSDTALTGISLANGYFSAWLAFLSALWFVSVQEINVQEEIANIREGV